MQYPLRDECYYQNLHDNSSPYQTNNWLCEDIDIIKRIDGRAIAEFGCGNGNFLVESAKYFDAVYGYDWAESPRMKELSPTNVSFTKLNLVETFPDIQVDVAASADFLEHLTLADIEKLIPKLHHCARYNYHKIACYDDGHSHQTIMSPAKWRRLFKTISPDYFILYINLRDANKNKRACVITNWKPPGLLFRLSMRFRHRF